MKIMMRESWLQPCLPWPSQSRSLASNTFDCHIKEQHMIWETPTAIDFRFGMEITMYVSHQ
jgi:coenzyme PQQ precursor peptide PqqA